VGSDTRAKFFVGNVPARPPRPEAWGKPFLNIPVFEPPVIAVSPIDGIPHINLDLVLEYLIGAQLRWPIGTAEPASMKLCAHRSWSWRRLRSTRDSPNHPRRESSPLRKQVVSFRQLRSKFSPRLNPAHGAIAWL